jgi:adenosine deaminase
MFPKAELHRHLEGAFSLPTLFDISCKNNLDLPKDFDLFKKEVQFPKDSEPDFLKFLSKFKNDWYRSMEDVERITYNSVKELKDDGIFYIEIRFSPEHFAYHNNYDRSDITHLIVRTANAAARDAGIIIRYLITFNRSKQDQNEMIELYDTIKSLEIPEIVGMDLAGDEINYPPEQFTKFFEHVNKDGIYKSTIHAGEVSPPDQIWKAIRLLGASRIGHGTSSIEDPELQAYLADHNIVLEQCITSNYQTGSWVDEKNHPLGRLYKAGVPVSINSDDPFIQDSDLTDDYVKAAEYFDLSLDDIIKLNRITLDGAFLPETEKKAIIAEYESRVLAFRGNAPKHGDVATKDNQE